MLGRNGKHLLPLNYKNGYNHNSVRVERLDSCFNVEDKILKKTRTKSELQG